MVDIYGCINSFLSVSVCVYLWLLFLLKIQPPDVESLFGRFRALRLGGQELQASEGSGIERHLAEVRAGALDAIGPPGQQFKPRHW